jgi:signal transduction histidine kinase
MGHAVTQGVTQRAVLRGDAIALRRCICNLVDNGIRYGGGARISLANDDGRCRVLVEDDGPGVPPATIERLCEPFYRGEASRNRETGGVGLGLSIGRAIAEAHDGTLHLENREEGGLRAILTLPLE